MSKIMKLVFKVYAGSGGMVCGGLIVDLATHVHTFYPANSPTFYARTYNHTPIGRVRAYKGLRLVRTFN